MTGKDRARRQTMGRNRVKYSIRKLGLFARRFAFRLYELHSLRLLTPAALIYPPRPSRALVMKAFVYDLKVVRLIQFLPNVGFWNGQRWRKRRVDGVGRFGFESWRAFYPLLIRRRRENCVKRIVKTKQLDKAKTD